MKEKLRTTSNQEEILAVLMEAMIKKISITLWQIIDGKRLVLEGKIIGLEEEISIKITKNELEEVTFEDGMALYLHGFHRSILFKQEILSINSDVLVLKLPDEIKLMELRKNPRYYYQYEDEQEITYFSDEIDKKGDVVSTLMDISKGGAGIILGEDRLKLVKSGDQILIKKISGQSIPKNFKGEIIHHRVYKKGGMSRGTLYLVGIRFCEDLPHISYKPGIVNEEEVETKRRTLNKIAEDARNNTNQYFVGYTADQLEEVLGNITKVNKKLAVQIKDNLEYLEKLTLLTPIMKQTLFRQVSTDELSLSLRLCEVSVISSLLADTSQTVRAEVYAAMQSRRGAEVVKIAQDKFITYLKKKESSGEFVFSAKGKNNTV